MALPISVKSVQDAIALTTAARTFTTTTDDPYSGDMAILTVLSGRTLDAHVRAMLVLARLVAESIPEDRMEAMAAKYAVMDRHAVVCV